MHALLLCLVSQTRELPHHLTGTCNWDRYNVHHVAPVGEGIVRFKHGGEHWHLHVEWGPGRIVWTAVTISALHWVQDTGEAHWWAVLLEIIDDIYLALGLSFCLLGDAWRALVRGVHGAWVAAFQAKHQRPFVVNFRDRRRVDLVHFNAHFYPDVTQRHAYAFHWKSLGTMCHKQPSEQLKTDTRRNDKFVI